MDFILLAHMSGKWGAEGLCLVLVVLLLLALWLAALVQLLKRADLDGTTKVCWVVVLCTLNVLGLVAFMIWGPRKYEEAPRMRRLFEPAKDKRATDDAADGGRRDEL